MKEFAEIQRIANEELQKIEWPAKPSGLYEPISYCLGDGGKRLRPAFALFACQLFCGDIQPAKKAALALEIFHNFTLMHDDIMDKADKRRGKPTVHLVWNENTAILSGDTMMALAYKTLAETNANVLIPALTLFNDTVIGVMEGQQYDMNFESRTDVQLEEYMEMIRLKTAVLLAASLKMGAICGKAKQEDADTLYEFGINVGLAFQLKDDLLDVYGDTKTFGKNIGGDIVDNKKTYLYIKAQELSKGTDKEKQLQHWFSLSTFDREEKIKAVTDIYNALGVKAIAENEMQKCYDKGAEAIDRTSLNKEQKNQLLSLANQLLDRKS